MRLLHVFLQPHGLVPAMLRSVPFVRLLALMSLCSVAGTMAACSTDTPAPVAAPAPPAASAQPTASPAPLASATQPKTQGQEQARMLAQGAQSAQSAQTSGAVSIDQHANALLRDEMGSAPAPLVQTLTPDAVQPDTQSRLTALEQSVAGLRAEFDAVLPAIRELVEAGRADRIAVASGTPTGAPEPLTRPAVRTPVNETRAPDSAPLSAALAPAPAPSSAPPKMVQTSTPTAPATSSTTTPSAGGQVTGVRVGHHPDRTRIVLDLSGPGTFQTDLDNTEHLLLIDLPQTGWRAPESPASNGKSLVTAWSSQAAHEGKGATAIFQLAGPAKILTASALRPDGKAGHRIVIDLAPEGK